MAWPAGHAGDRVRRATPGQTTDRHGRSWGRCCRRCHRAWRRGGRIVGAATPRHVAGRWRGRVCFDSGRLSPDGVAAGTTCGAHGDPFGGRSGAHRGWDARRGGDAPDRGDLRPGHGRVHAHGIVDDTPVLPFRGVARGRARAGGRRGPQSTRATGSQPRSCSIPPPRRSARPDRCRRASRVRRPHCYRMEGSSSLARRLPSRRRYRRYGTRPVALSPPARSRTPDLGAPRPPFATARCS